MIPKPKETGETGGRDRFKTYDKLTIDINEVQFSTIQQAEQVRLRMFSGINTATLMAQNIGSARRRSDEIACINLHLDEEQFVSMMNPELKIVFRSNNVLAPYRATALFKEPLFSAAEPLGEQAFKN
ncbi:MAG TPA: hypothetical protein VLD37_01685 [Candidatus Bilamarchaeum sp.]|nr:hypothetical protein [Candidatus Bilamarchaeum sp.]